MPKTKDPESIWLKRKKQAVKIDIETWREYWKKAGPIRFAEEYLFCPPQVPPYPDWKKLQIEDYCEGCKTIHKKFDDIGIPIHVVLSEDQKVLLNDIWLNGIRLILVSAGRGSGKTFILAIWNTWRLCTQNYYDITCMGGSAGQSKIIQKFMDFWRIKHLEVGYIINESPKAMGNRSCQTRMGGECKFIACSPTSAMGPHVDEVQIDEACAAESKGIEGREAIEAVDWQIVGRKDSFVWMSSTSHFLLGKFYEILTEPTKHGFKVYYWSIAKHISGKPLNQVYTDRNPKNWLPAIWWVTKDDIEKLRKRKSNEEWLCMALGYPSLSSGQLFKRTDLSIAICDICLKEGKECLPYQWGHCKLIERYGLGDAENPTKSIEDIRAGFDYGDPSPCALIIAGTKGKLVFILYGEEQKGLSIEDLENWLKNKMEYWKVQLFVPDPSIGGKHVNEKIDNMGYAVMTIDEQAKEERVNIVQSLMEKHAFVIPVAFWHLTNSLKMVHRDEQGRIVKYNDHCFDALCYVCVDWGDTEGSVSDFFEVMSEQIGEKITEYPEPEEEENEEDIFFKKGIKLWKN